MQKVPSLEVETVSDTTLLGLHLSMLRIRLFEERLVDLLFKEEIKCPCHLYIGQEAIAVGVCAALDGGDYVYSNYRSHGHYLAKGGDMKALMAEIYGRATGCSGGFGGSMHVVDRQVGILGTSAIVAGTIPMAVGTGLMLKRRGPGRVVASFFGDGATDEGVFWEALNFASLKKLPVVFVCENNGYSTHLPLLLRQPANNIHQRVRTFKVPAARGDGNDVVGVYRKARGAVAETREGAGPCFLEFRTYRWRAHVGPWADIDVGFRNKQEVEYWLRRCPIKRAERVLLRDGILTRKEMASVYERVRGEVEEAYRFALASPFPDPAEVEGPVYTRSRRHATA